MTPDRWQRVQQLFYEADSLPPAEQREFLERPVVEKSRCSAKCGRCWATRTATILHFEVGIPAREPCPEQVARSQLAGGP